MIMSVPTFSAARTRFTRLRYAVTAIATLALSFSLITYAEACTEKRRPGPMTPRVAHRGRAGLSPNIEAIRSVASE